MSEISGEIQSGRELGNAAIRDIVRMIEQLPPKVRLLLVPVVLAVAQLACAGETQSVSIESASLPEINPTETSHTEAVMPTPSLTPLILPEITETLTPTETPLLAPTAIAANPEEVKYGTVWQSYELHNYRDERADVIKRVYDTYGVAIVVPVVPEIYLVNNNEGESKIDVLRVVNAEWTLDDLMIIEEAINKSPQEFFGTDTYPLQIALVKFDKEVEGIGGWYNGRNMMITVPSSFQAEAKPFDDWDGLVENQRDELISTVIHELTHSYTEAHPEFLDEYADVRGWYMDSEGNWKNSDPNSIPDIKDWNNNPTEGVAFDVPIMIFDSAMLPEEVRTFLETSFPSIVDR